MVTDIVPDLLVKIQRDFNRYFKQSKKIKRLSEIINNGKATYQHANQYAIEVGELLAKAFEENLNSETLPDGKMYYNIAERVLTPTLRNNHVIIAQVSAEIQERLNESIGLGIRGIEPPVNQLRIDSLINRIDAEEMFDDVAWILDEPVVNFTQSVVDDTIKENVEFLGGSGLYPKLIRTTHGVDVCDWCRNLSGVYKYPNIPDDIYKRHDRCRCTVEYDPGDARRQNVWTKEWSDA